MIMSGSKVKETKAVGQFATAPVLTVKARSNKQILVVDSEGREFWRNVANVIEVADVK